MQAMQEEKPVFHEGISASAALLNAYAHNVTADWAVAVSCAPDEPGLPGDCPHCQRVLMILLHKNIDFHLIVINNQRPCKVDWIASRTNQQTPLLRHKQHVLSDVNDISEYIETECPEPSLFPSDYDLIDIGSDLFADFFLYIKNKRPNLDDTLREKVVSQLAEINDRLLQSGGPFVDGASLTLADCNLWPKLHHVLVALGHFKQFSLPDEYLAILAYVGTMMEHDLVQRTRYPDSWVHQHWKKYQ
eukprot:c18015_g1_i1.p1 GENE.c18015_g1_i1~~c18015_g1_i1.p1  ORF type:complete len:272 (-),score=65.21 c18015_g1_i1:28-765(-)